MQSQNRQRHSVEGRRPAFGKRRRKREGGFIQTLEFLLLLSIFGSVVYFGLELVKGWLIQTIDPMGGKNVVVYDNPGPAGEPRLLTRTNSFVGNEAPVKIYRVATNEAAVLGLRGEANGGYTTHQRLYFSGPGITGCDSGFFTWIVDPTTAAASLVQNLPWNLPLPSGYLGSGHQTSDFYTLQMVAFAMGPPSTLAPFQTELYRAYGSQVTGVPAGYDAAVFGWPAYEWDSERYDGERCRYIGDTMGPPNPEQVALRAVLVQAENVFNVTDSFGEPYYPNFWAPTQVNGNEPPALIDSEGPGFYAPGNEASPTQGVSPVTFTDADGIVHTVGTGEGAP